MAFADHFSTQSNAYAAFRPSYPDALGQYLAALIPTPGNPAPTQVWDCATGSGQAATMLARHFDRVVATDASAAQIEKAEAADRVEYGVAPADASGLPAQSCDVVTVAQAAHWIDLPPFYSEVRRVLKPGGVIAVWCYALLQSGHEPLDVALLHLQSVRVGPYWPSGRELVEDHYQSLDFPFELIEAPSFEMTKHWTQADLMGFLGSWSAVARCRQAEGTDPLVPFAEELKRVWRTDAERVTMRWPLYLRVGRVTGGLTARPARSDKPAR